MARSRWNYDKLGCSLVYYKVQWTVVTSLVHYKVRWNYDKLRQLSLLQSAMNSCLKFWQISYKVWHGLNCDKYYIVWWIYYKLRKVLQSAMIIRTLITNVHAYYYTIKFWCTFPIISINWPLTAWQVIHETEIGFDYFRKPHKSLPSTPLPTPTFCISSCFQMLLSISSPTKSI